MDTRFLGHRPLLSGRRVTGGPLLPIAAPISETFDPALFEGAIAYGRDQQFHYSDGVEWRVPSEDVVIARPSALVPTTAFEQMQLRLTQFYSPAGLSQIGARFEVAAAEDGFGAPLFTRTILGEVSSYTTLYPEDGLVPGQAFWWRALYYGTEGQQSDWSTPFAQVYPAFITPPVPVTRDGITSGVVELSAFESAFGFQYAETQVEFYDPANLSTPVLAVVSQTGAIATIPSSLVEGREYLWRARYGGRANEAGTITYTPWTELRSVFNGAASIVLVYDPNLAINRTITLGLGTEQTSATVNVTVDWGDGAVESFTSRGNRTHSYAPGFTQYATVTISGQLTQFGGNYDQTGLIRVNAIGFKMGLASLRRAFARTTRNLAIFSVSLPAQITDLSFLFFDSDVSPEIWPGIGGLDVSAVQSLNSVFRDASFNGDLSGWDVSAVVDFGFAFAYKSTYARLVQFSNDSITGWNVSAGQDFTGMFAGDQGSGTSYRNRFDEDISGWAMANARSLASMFRYGMFNQDISGWDVSGVADFSRMFERNTAFSRSLNAWDVRSGTNFTAMFADSAYPGNCAGWDMSNATSIAFMFAGTGGVIDVTGWDTANVTNMANLFQNCSSVTGEAGFDTSNVTDMAYMFFDTPVVPQVQTWDVSRVLSFSDMLRGVAGIPDLSAWDVRAAGNFSRMFFGTNIASADLSRWNVSAATTFENMFGSASQYSAGAAGWDLPAAIAVIRPNWSALTVDTYSETLIGWANHVAAQNGPHNVLFDNGTNALRFDATLRDPGGRFETATAARAFLIGPRSIAIAGATDAGTNGLYAFNAASSLYEQGGWYVGKEGSDWVLRDPADVARATGGGNHTEPYLVAAWTGLLGPASVLRAGAGWTITGDVQS